MIVRLKRPVGTVPGTETTTLNWTGTPLVSTTGEAMPARDTCQPLLLAVVMIKVSLAPILLRLVTVWVKVIKLLAIRAVSVTTLGLAGRDKS